MELSISNQLKILKMTDKEFKKLFEFNSISRKHLKEFKKIYKTDLYFRRAYNSFYKDKLIKLTEV